MYKFISVILFLCVVIGGWFLYSEIYRAEAQHVEKISFKINAGEDVSVMATRLSDEQVVRHAWLFRRYLILKGIDRNVEQGEYEVYAPITIARVAEALLKPGVGERTITILPGWDLGDIAEYFEKEGIASSTDFFAVVGKPAFDYRLIGTGQAPYIETDLRVVHDKPVSVSYEGYLVPDTYRIFTDASVESIVRKLITQRDGQFTQQMYADIETSGRTVFEILTMASIIEREVRSSEDRKKVADLFWRRYDANWALQADSTVHYAVRKKGNVFTTKEDRDSLSPWNTYKYPGLPRGPISNPSLDSIMATIYPEENEYWYFLTTNEGDVKYAKDLDEHNTNVEKYLR